MGHGDRAAALRCPESIAPASASLPVDVGLAPAADCTPASGVGDGTSTSQMRIAPIPTPYLRLLHLACQRTMGSERQRPTPRLDRTRPHRPPSMGSRWGSGSGWDVPTALRPSDNRGGGPISANLGYVVSLERAFSGAFMERGPPRPGRGKPLGEIDHPLNDEAQIVPDQLGNPPNGVGCPGGRGTRRGKRRGPAPPVHPPSRPPATWPGGRFERGRDQRPARRLYRCAS